MSENETLGNYRVLHLIGDGGFAKVYLGEHLYLKTYAAIKVPKTRLDANDLEAFLNEARRGVGLRHPNVLRTLECGVQGGTQPYIIMEYAPGGSLSKRYPAGTPMPPQALISYTKQVGAGLQYIHDQGLIHQDIKPGNMLLGSNDEVLLSDFGIAAVAHRNATRSMSDASGTIRYMAPEQFIGKARPASDQYALAIVVYEWISGSSPFSGDIGELYYKHTHVAPPPLHEKMPGIAPTVEQVILKALAKDPRDRFPNVQDFVSALEMAGRPGATSPMPPVSSPIRIPIPTPTPASGFLAPHVEEDIPTVQSTQPPPVRVEYRVSPNEDAIPTVISHTNLPAVGAGIPLTRPVDTPRSLPSYQVAPPPPAVEPQSGQRKGRRQPTRTAVLLVSLAIILVAASLSFFLISLKNSHGGSVTPTITTRPHRTLVFTPVLPYSPMFGFNARHAHYIPDETTLNPSNVARLTLTRKMATDDSIRSSPVVANGIAYITTQRNSLFAFTIATGTLLWQKSAGSYTSDVGSFIYSTPAISNGVLYVGSNDHHLYAFNATTGALLWNKALTGGPIYSSPSVVNNVVYVGSNDHNIYAFNATDGSLLWKVPTGDKVFSSPAVVNNVVYVGSLDTKLYALDAATGKTLWTGLTPNHINSSPTVVDGMVYIGDDDGSIYAFDATGCKGQPSCSPLWTASTGTYIYSSPAVANGILYIGSHDNKLYAFDTQKCLNATSSCSPLWTAQTTQPIESSPTVANGVVYIGSKDNKLYAYNAQSGALLWSYPTGGQVISSPTVLNGVVYVGSTDQNLYAFHIVGTP